MRDVISLKLRYKGMAAGKVGKVLVVASGKDPEKILIWTHFLNAGDWIRLATVLDGLRMP
jgi:hypothetical protein